MADTMIKQIRLHHSSTLMSTLASNLIHNQPVITMTYQALCFMAVGHPLTAFLPTPPFAHYSPATQPLCHSRVYMDTLPWGFSIAISSALEFSHRYSLGSLSVPRLCLNVSFLWGFPSSFKLKLKPPRPQDLVPFLLFLHSTPHHLTQYAFHSFIYYLSSP